MILIHQRKSAGTSLIHGLSEDLGLEIATDDRPNIFNARGARLMKAVGKFEAPNTPIASYHLHPTREIFAWIRDHSVRAVVLLREPEGSYEALFRHRNLDGSHTGPNVLASYNEPLEILKEFNHSWRCLVDSPHLLFISYDDVVSSYPMVLSRVAQHYGITPHRHGVDGAVLPKVRFSGARDLSQQSATDLSKTSEPTFKYRPDYSHSADFRRRVREALPSPLLRILRAGRNYLG